MKSVTFLFFILVGSFFAKGQTGNSCGEILDQASVEAKIQNKNIIIVFTASWCHSCRELKDSILNDKRIDGVAELFRNRYIIKYVNVYENSNYKHLETPGGKEYLSNYFSYENVSLPFYIILNKEKDVLGNSFMKKSEDGKIISNVNIGRPLYDDEVEAFVKLISLTSNIGDKEIDQIKRRLKSNR